jgi:DNA mismatch repair protein MutS
MNASGKSSLMKAVGIAVILAQVGCYVPATSMTIAPFQKIATRILNQDNLWAGLSSFAVEMSELRDIFQVADAKTLVLGDELCSGTESVSATSIVAAGIQWLHQKGARYVLATHLHDLMKLPGVTNCAGLKVWHLHVEYDRVQDLLIYHRNLKPGAGNTLYGLEVARALHLPHDMILLAQQYRTTLLGSTSLEEAPQSAWNRSMIRKECEICHCEITKDLEVHHIQERQHATSRHRNQDGTGLHDARNLVVLCETCHDAHHAGQIHIQPIVDTSIGAIRPDTSSSESSSSDSSVAPELKSLEKYRYVKKEQFTEEEMKQIMSIVKKHKGLHVKLLLFQIQKQHPEIEITLSQLQAIVKK